MFVPDYPTVGNRPATYNPRAIKDEGISTLRASLRELGVVRPVVVTKSGVILAGHQRSVAMQAEGITSCPAYVLRDMPISEEIRFNQLHNGSDIEVCGSPMRVPPHAPGFVELRHKEVQGHYSGSNKARLKEICRLMALHGPFSGFVATASGEVLVGAIYGHACRLMAKPALCCYVPDERREDVLRYFSRSYGHYSYDHLSKTTWAQSMAQMNRLRSETKGKSRTYELQVIPRLKPGMRVLDFGAGKFDYVEALRAQGHDIRGIEFYYRREFNIDVPRVHRDISELCRELGSRGRWDMVVCDSVLNSVDSNQAERDVLLCLGALCKPQGSIIFSGRSREKIEKEMSAETSSDTRTYVQFLDHDGASAMFSNGVWLYQRYHSRADIEKLVKFYGPEGRAYNSEGRAFPAANTSGWCVVAPNLASYPQEEIEEALGREFNLPLPGGKSYGRSEDIIRAWRTLLY